EQTGRRGARSHAGDHRADRPSTLAHRPTCRGEEIARALHDRVDDYRGRRSRQQPQERRRQPAAAGDGWIVPAMTSLDTAIQDLVIANRILAKEDVVDAYGHVSIRHPDNPNHFLIARSLAPELVTAEDIVELGAAAARQGAHPLSGAVH